MLVDKPAGKKERLHLLKLFAELDYNRVAGFVIKSYDSTKDSGRKLFLLECFHTLNITDRYIDNLSTMNRKKMKAGALALGRIDSNLVTYFLKVFSNKESETKLKLVELLEYIGHGEIDEHLKEILEIEKNEKVLSKAIKVYSEFADQSNILLMGKILLSQDDPRVRANAIEALEKGGEQAIELIKKFLDDPNNRIRANAAKAVAQSGDKEGVETLHAMLEMKDPGMKASALWALGEMGEGDSVARIRNFIEHPDEMVSRNARSALKKLETKKSV